MVLIAVSYLLCRSTQIYRQLLEFRDIYILCKTWIIYKIQFNKSTNSVALANILEMSQSKEIDYFKSIKLSMSKAFSEDGRRVSTNNITEGIMSYGMQQIYRFNKWGTSCKTIDLKVDIPSFILGNDLTPQRVKLVQDKSRVLQDDGNQNKYRMLMLSNSSDIRVDTEPKQEEIISKETYQTQETSGQDYDDEDYQETEKQMKEKSKQILQIYQNTILFTYRKNFYPLLKDKINDPQKNQTSDAGWGCMIRAGQMIFAQTIKRHLKKTDYIEQHQLINIIIGFLEEEEVQEGGKGYIFNQQSYIQDRIRPYSIHQITNRAFCKYKIQPGQWYTPNQIAIILKELHKKNKIKGTENLKIDVHSSDKPIIFEKILQTLLGRQGKINLNCNHENQQSRNSINQDQDDSFEKIMPPNQQEIEEFSSQYEESKEDQTDNLCCKDCFKTDNKLFLLLPCRLGLDEISPIHIEILKKLLSLKQSVGMIGGKPNKAHYFLGFVGDDLLYLDPHYIKECVRKEDLMENISSYFEEDVFKMPINKISTSLVFGFYFSGVDELNKFYKFLRQLEKEYKDDFFLVIEKQTPSYAMSNISEIKKLTKQIKITQKDNQNLLEQQFENYDGSVGDDFDEDDDTSYDEQECYEDKLDEFDQYNNLEESDYSQKLKQQTNLKNYSDPFGTESHSENQLKYGKLANHELPIRNQIQKKQSEEELKNLVNLIQLQQQNQQISNLLQNQNCI
ncbi:peptidase family C54 protein (macronuclear) [Tetrahymena thermophila SB210]|uniref:Cysteine protease n=1 Tax=Tetrahymena thermophila (strain SB210) TaxID=312017 RepID=I7MN29_TETTS|nr:peptidase family C54 protein [Tetrahymena thermophila SB210]EAS07796.2 peptidase family C54 protein [Tetrahymena thermophila SB210]|eukprot:XP_001028038.2 peptidase family C54 protein [Tetrahymena thermophila SB210]